MSTIARASSGSSTDLVVRVAGAGNGTTDDTAALQAAVNSLDPTRGGTVWLPPGRRYNFSSLTITTPHVTLDGPGTLLNGTVYIGAQSGYAPVEMWTRIRVSFDRTARSTTADAVVVANSQHVDICDLAVNNYRALVAFPSLALGGSNVQHSARIRVSGCRTPYWSNSVTNTTPIDYLVYIGANSSGGVFSIGDLSVVDNPSVNVGIAHISGTGLDGLVCTGNTFFFPGYQRALGGKLSHVLLTGTNDWITITGNQLFEAGYESINITEPRNVTITGNNIAWPGQRDLRDAIALTTTSYVRGTVAGNNLQLYTKAAVAVYGTGDASGLIIGPNACLATNPNTFYYGSATLPASFSRYTADSTLSNLPRIAAGTGSYAGTTTNDVIGAATVESYQRLGNRSSLMSRGKAVSVTAASTVIGGVSSATGSSSLYGGLLAVFVQDASAVTRCAHYLISVSGSGAARTVTVAASDGETTGATALAPSFTWAINSSNQLLASPVGSASGSFTFFVTALGNLRFA